MTEAGQQREPRVLHDAHALVIGISAYRHIRPLPFVLDAQDVATVLVDPALCGYPADQVVTLYEAEATRGAILDALDRLAARAGASSTVFVYFSGHGGRTSGGDGEGCFLMPIEARWERDEDIEATAISSRELGARLGRIAAARVTVVLDCCRAAGLAEPRDLDAETAFRAELPPGSLAGLAAGRGRVVMAASSSDGYAYVRTGERNGIFTRHLLAGLRGAAAGEGDVIRVFELYDYVRVRVTEDHAAQRPSFHSFLEDNYPIALAPLAVRPALPSVLEVLERRAQEARPSLSPHVLDVVARASMHERHQRLAAGLSAGASIIAVVFGEAGCGKSTVLGEIFDRTDELGAGWRVIVPCDALSLPERPSEEDVDRAMGGGREPLSELCSRAAAERGLGLVLIDTLDLVLTRATAPSIVAVLGRLRAAGACVVATCRTTEFRALLDPNKRLAHDPWPLGAFERDEMLAAAKLFARRWAEADGGTAFAESLASLTAGEERLDAIARHPLLLSMLCELFARDGNVPRDLTVAALYRRYWRDKVEHSRRYDQGSPVVYVKPQLCLRIGEWLLGTAATTIAREDLVLGSEHEAAAFEDLVSESVLHVTLDGRVGFFHQTFLEYASARWLRTRAGADARRRMLVEVSTFEDELAGLGAWPVLRQLLSIVDDAEYRSLVERLPLSRIVAFRNTALAAGARTGAGALRQLLPAALGGTEVHRWELLVALDSVLADHLEEAIEVACRILSSGEHDAAVNAARTLGRLCRRDGGAGSIAAALAAIAEAKPARDREGAAAYLEVLGQFLAALEGRAYGADTLWTLWEALTSNGLDWDQVAAPAERILALYLTPGVEPDAQRRVLAALEELPVHGPLVPLADRLTWALLPRSGGEDGAEVLARLLARTGPRGWSTVWARVGGCLVAVDEHARERAVRSLLLEPASDLGAPLIVLSEAVRQGAAADVARSLVAISPTGVTPRGRKALPATLRELVPRLEGEALEALRCWAASLGHDRAFTAHRGGARPPIAGAASRNAAVDASDEALAREALRRDDRDRAREASEALLERVRQGRLRDGALLVSLLASKLIAVRNNAAEALSHLSPGEALDAASQRALADAVEAERDVQVRQRLCDMVKAWAERAVPGGAAGAPRVPPLIAEAVGRMAARAAGGEPLSNGLAFDLLGALTSIARREALGAHPGLSGWIASVLRAIDLRIVQNAERSANVLLPAAHRHDPALLERLVRTGHEMPSTNSLALAIAVVKCHGKDSKLVDDIAAAPWCSTAALNYIQRVRGA